MTTVIDSAVSVPVFEIRTCCSLKWGLLLVTTGVTVTVPSPPPDAFTVSAIVVVRESVPDVPVMVTLAVPIVAVLDAANVTVLLFPVVEVGLKAAVTPLGNPLALNATAPVKPPVRVIATDALELDPRVTANVAGDAATE
jgi:hypothetical protein